MLYIIMLCVCHTTPTQKLLCLHDFRQAGPSQRVDCLLPRWEIALTVFPKNTASCYRIGSPIKVLQLSITSHALYQLSYAGIYKVII